MIVEDERFNLAKLTDLTPYRTISVLNVGGGAVGSYLAEQQARKGVDHITVNDFDRYEKDNAPKTSALIRLSDADGAVDVGRWKAEALPERAQAIMFKGSHANGIVGSIENLGPMAFSSYDVVFAAPDNKAAREYVNQQLKMLPPEKRPVYIVGGTDGEMATSAIFTDLDKACYRCMCEEDSFKSSRQRTSCADAQYRFTKDGLVKDDSTASGSSSLKAAMLMIEELDDMVTGNLLFRNLNKVWNPHTRYGILLHELGDRSNCPDCKRITAPGEVILLNGDSLTTTLRSVLEQIQANLQSDDFELSVHRHRYGEDSFTEYVRRDYCRSCGATFGVYRHTRFVNSENDLICESCRSRDLQPQTGIAPGEVDILYGFTPEENDNRILNASLFELGYPIGAYLWVTQYNGAFDLSDPRVKTYCFSMGNDSLVVKQNINLMEESENGQR